MLCVLQRAQAELETDLATEDSMTLARYSIESLARSARRSLVGVPGLPHSRRCSSACAAIGEELEEKTA